MDPSEDVSTLAAMKGTSEEILDRLRGLATDFHRKKKFGLAAELYRAMLARKDRAEIRYYLGSVLFERKRWAEAGEELARVDDPKYGPLAARDAAVAFENAKDTDRFVAAVDRLAKLSEDVSVAPFLFRAAQIAREAGDLQAERARLEVIVNRWPQEALAMRSAMLVLASFEKQEAWKALRKKAEAYLAGPMKSAKIQRIADGAGYREVQIDERRARMLDGAAKELALVEVAESFAKLAEKNAESEFADEALMSAALIRSQIGRVDGALEASSLLAERYPKSEHTARNRLLYAELTERVAKFEEAARIYHQFAKEFPKHPEAATALLRASDLYRATGKTRSARDALGTFVKLYEKSDEAPKAFLARCELFSEMKDERGAMRCYRKMQKFVADAEMKLLARYGEAEAAAKLGKKTTKLYRSVVARFDASMSDAARHAAAGSAFSLVEPRLAEFRKLPLTLKAKRVKKKAKMFEALEKRYVEVIEYRDAEYAIAGLLRLGETHLAMAEALENAPIPPGLTQEQIDMYRAAIGDRIAALEAKAIELFETAIERGREHEVAAAWVAAASQQLAQLKPDPPPETSIPAPDPLNGLIENQIKQADGSTISR